MIFNINRFYFFALLTWQFALFFSSQMIYPIFSNYLPKWRCSRNETFTSDCHIYLSCNQTVEFEPVNFFFTITFFSIKYIFLVFEKKNEWLWFFGNFSSFDIYLILFYIYFIYIYLISTIFLISRNLFLEISFLIFFY